MDVLNGLPHTIKQWESAGTSLLDAFKHYADTCNLLGEIPINMATEPENLASKIQSILETVHAAISERLPKTTATLTRTRNKLVSPVSQIPEEVLSEIFANAVSYGYRPSTSEPRALTMKQNIRRMYNRLHTLRRVCSSWRDIITTREAFWSVIPVILEGRDSDRLAEIYQQSFERARGCPLHLAAVINSTDDPEIVYRFFGLLLRYGPRFSTINLVMNDPSSLIKGVIHMLSEDVTKPLSELSLAQESSAPYDGDRWSSEPLFPAVPMASKRQHVALPHDSSQQTIFVNMLESLAAFRVRSIYIHWDTITFSSRLVELYISNIDFGYDNEITPFLDALSSAVALRDLKIISIFTYRSTDEPAPFNSPTVTLPKLQSLLLQDMYLNTLKPLLSAISPGPYRLTLILGPESLKLRQYTPRFHFGLRNDDSEDSTDFSEAIQVWSSLGPIQVDTLVMRPIGLDMWPAFHTLLSAMPNLKTLKLDSWMDWYPTTQAIPGTTQGPFQSDQGPPFSALESFHLTRMSYGWFELIQQMVSSYAPRQVVIGGELQGRSPARRNTLAKWIRDNGRDVRVVETTYCPPELCLGYWRIW